MTDPNVAIAFGGHITTYEYEYSGTTLESISAKSPNFNVGTTYSYIKNTLNNSSYGDEESILVSVDPEEIDPDDEITISRNSYSNDKLISSADARQIQEDAYISYSYNSNGWLSSQNGPEVTQLNGDYTNLYTTYTYYPDGRIKTETVSNNNYSATRITTTYLYNYLGHPTGTETKDYYGNFLSSTHSQSNGFGETIYSIDNSGVARGKEYDNGGKVISEFVFADPNDTALFDGDDPNVLLEDISGVYVNLEVVSQTCFVYNDLGQLYQTKVAVADDVFTYDTPDSWYVTQFGYDSYGRKTTQIEDVGGLALTTTYAFNNQGQVVKTTYPDSHWTKQIRNGRGLVIRTIDGHGPENTEPNDFMIRETVYDADGNAVKESVAGSVTQSYVLDDMGGVWRAYQGDYETEYCDFTEYVRDFDGHVIDQNSVDVDAYENETVIQQTHNRYNTRGELIEQRILEDPEAGTNDLLDRVQLFSYDHQGRLVETVTKADGNDEIYTDQYENEVEYEAGDKVEQNWYGPEGNLEYTFRFEYVGNSAASYALPFGSLEDAFAYAKDSGEVYVAAQTYSNGRISAKETLKGFDEDNPYFNNYSYPFAGLIWHPAQSLEYDNTGRMVKTIDADDNFKVFAYNSRNQQTEQTLWQGKPILRLSDGSYDPNTFDPYPIRRDLTAYDTAGRKSLEVVLYDPNENIGIDEINMAWDKITDFVYNADGQLYRQKELIGQEGVSRTFALTELTYDDHGRVDQILYGQLEEVDVFGSLWETKTTLKTIGYQYNTKGQKTVQTVTEVNTSDYTTANFSTYFYYDSQGRLDEIQNATGIIYACKYDVLGRKIEETDAVGKVTQHDYYTTGELHQKTENPTGLDRQTIYGHDRFGRQISIASGSDQTDYAYSYLDLITDVNYAGGDSISFGYDMLGLATRRTVTKDSQSVTTHYKRDALGRVCYKQYTGEANWTEPNSLLPFDEVLYNAAGQKEIIAYMSNGNDLELNMYSYDGFGNLTGAGETSADFSSSVSYGYDQRGLLISITYPDEKMVAYTRDALGRIDSVAYDGKLLSDYYYLGDTVVNKTMTAADIEYAATVDALGRITGETFSDISTSTAFMTNSYDYTSYSYRMDERNDIDYTFDGLGKLTTEDSTSYTSDILGNPTNAADDGLTYTFDNEDRVTQVSDVSGTLGVYDYDRLGRRAKKTVDGVDTNFVYDIYGNVIAEYEDGDWSRDYIYGAKGEVVYMRIPQTTEMNTALENFTGFIEAWLCNTNCTQDDLLWDYDDSNDINLVDWAMAVDANDFAGAFATNGRYLLTDFRNSVIGKVNLDGSLYEISYNAWGTPSYLGDLEGLPILWNGYYLDDETDNYYLRNRYYSPLERRFLAEDPHGINPDGNWNNPFGIKKQYYDGYGLQVYAGHEPINKIDPWGTDIYLIGSSGWRPVDIFHLKICVDEWNSYTSPDGETIYFSEAKLCVSFGVIKEEDGKKRQWSTRNKWLKWDVHIPAGCYRTGTVYVDEFDKNHIISRTKASSKIEEQVEKETRFHNELKSWIDTKDVYVPFKWDCQEFSTRFFVESIYL
jgi:RHS repeat-associated protein